MLEDENQVNAMDYTTEQIRAAFAESVFSDYELKILLAILENPSPTAVQSTLNKSSLSTVKNYLKDIYSKLGISDARKNNKGREAQSIIRQKIKEQNEKRNIYIIWAGDKGRDIAKILCDSIFFPFMRQKVLLSSHDLNCIRKDWWDEASAHLSEVTTCFICISDHLYDSPRLAFNLGKLNGRVQSCHIVYTDETRDGEPTSCPLSEISGFHWRNSEKWSEYLEAPTCMTRKELINLISTSFNPCKSAEASQTNISNRQGSDEIRVVAKKLAGLVNTGSPLVEEEYLNRLAGLILPKSPVLLVQETLKILKEAEEKLEKKIEERLSSKGNVESENNIDAIFSSFGKEAQQLPEFALSLRILDTEGDFKEFINWGSNSRFNWDERDHRSRRPGKGYIQMVLTDGEPQFIPQLSQKIDRFQNKAWIQSNKFTSFAAFPLKVGKDVVGVLCFYFLDEYDLRREHKSRALIECLARLLSNLIIRKRNLEALHELIKSENQPLPIADSLKETQAIIQYTDREKVSNDSDETLSSLPIAAMLKTF